MILQHAFDAGLERIRRAGCGESKIEIHDRGARNNVGRARARMQVRYLECRRGEIVVAVIPVGPGELGQDGRSEEHTSEHQSLLRNSYADFCLKTKNGSTK